MDLFDQVPSDPLVLLTQNLHVPQLGWKHRIETQDQVAEILTEVEISLLLQTLSFEYSLLIFDVK